ncbi:MULTISPECIES: flippase [unclassified Cobetia]|uniref:flippase n=1 Tax=unclassified Cobetia TaxID=2609414 RepID=UPI002097D22B|nr:MULTISPECIES: flippase [unclassified Cobetia]MCO7234132.1 flippase [Cobetia sp. Dlab-2-AX]MCO7237409.1 flippase [Cobetia sp. Dlab-2-U]
MIKQLFKSGALSIGVKFGYLGLQFIIGVILARYLGPTSLGLYAVTMALVQIGVVIAQFGFPAYLVRIIAVQLAQKKYSEINLSISNGLKLVSFLSFLLIVFIVLVVSFFDLNPNQEYPILLSLLLIPLLSLEATTGGIIRGLGFVTISIMPGHIIRPTIFLALLLSYPLFFTNVTAKEVIISNAIALSFSVLIGLYLLNNKKPNVGINKPEESSYRDVLTKALPFLFLAGAQVLNYQVDIIMLGQLTSALEVGYYRIAIQLSDGIGGVLLAISLVIAPQIARLHALKDWSRIQQIVVIAHRAGFLILLPVGVIISLYSEFFIVNIFGKEYESASESLILLVIGKIIYATVGFAGIVMSMLGRAGAATTIALVTLIANVALNITLIPIYGIEGAAIATIFSQVIVNSIGVIYIYRLYKIDISALGSWIHRITAALWTAR